MVLFLTPSFPEQDLIGKKWRWGFSSQPLGKATTVPWYLGLRTPQSALIQGQVWGCSNSRTRGEAWAWVQHSAAEDLSQPPSESWIWDHVPCPDPMNRHSACPTIIILGVPCSRERSTLKSRVPLLQSAA